MAEKIKDADDRRLESMFHTSPIADDGFSDRIVKRIRRKLYLRRLTLPVAATLGGLLAFKPFTGLINSIYRILLDMPMDFLPSATAYLPSLQLTVTGGLILFVVLMSLSMLED
ncbi:MAG: DUF5056 domain-containing protein [Gammaproteobacteria bacterium]|nr:DUF5056 domain-containing protein [Gammaproteobacteria bacterium]MBU2675473.1 DUF5056 domain-containing protein [Gammaproteobacteria bacterium]NNL49208.1 hypothetical protein [Woeseiaceae bacterium]